MGGYLLSGNLLLRFGLPFLVFSSGEKGFQCCGNVPLFRAPCDVDRSLLSFGGRDSLDHTHGWRDDPHGSLLGIKKIARLKS